MIQYIDIKLTANVHLLINKEINIRGDIKLDKKKYQQAVLDLSCGMLNSSYPYGSRLYNLEYLKLLQNCYMQTEDVAIKNHYKKEIDRTNKQINNFNQDDREIELLNKINNQEYTIYGKQQEVDEIMRLIKEYNNQELFIKSQHIVDKYESWINLPMMRL